MNESTESELLRFLIDTEIVSRVDVRAYEDSKFIIAGGCTCCTLRVEVPEHLQSTLAELVASSVAKR